MKIRNINKIFVLGCSLFLGISIPCLIYGYVYVFPAYAKSTAPPKAPFEMLNKSFPDSNLLEIDNDLNLASKLKQGTVLVIFLQTKCPACLKDTEIISKSYSTLSSKMKIYGISIERKEVVKEYIKEKDIQFPVLLDDNGELYKKLQIKYFPTKFLLQDGIVLNTWVGNFRDENHLFEQLQITK